ncbi:MAG: creatininase [Candidatus Rokuibacteriota bacterium]|nr:MAG: creatininase [Candidatus Rokubacteria bacterium]
MIGAPMDDPELTRGGYSVFHETVADLTFPEVEALAREGAVALWGLGVIEEHGPHLPLGTDVYLPYATLKLTRRLLEARSIKALVLPPFYWGINNVTGSFAGSITVRPDTMTNLMLDVFQSLRKDGIECVFCVSGQGDALHNQTMAQAIARGRVESGIRAYFVVSSAWAERLGFDAEAPHILVYPLKPPPTTHADVHAGSGETSMMWAHYPRLVRTDLLPKLEPTRFTAEDLAEWRKGWANARRKTPHGYLGDPAAADPDRGRTIVETHARLVADTIAAKLASGSP